MSNLPVKKERHPISAIVSAFVPGLGQFLKGHVAKGIGIFLVLTGLGFASWLLSFILGPLAGLVMFLGWATNVADAYLSNDDEALLK